MEEKPFKIVQISSDRWQEFKELRLRALVQNPCAFDSSPEEESHLSEEVWRERLEDHHGFKVFAEKDGRLIAKMEVEWRDIKKVNFIAEVYGVFIEEHYRGQNLGKLLMDEVERVSRTHNIQKLWLDVVVTQQAAMKLYKKLGFREIGRMEKAIKVDGEYYDKLLMEKFI